MNKLDFITLCQACIGSQYVLTEAQEQQAYLTEWRQRATGKAMAILLPANTEQVAALVKLCVQFSVAIVPQGGNTGLVIGSIPDQSGNAVVMSLKRLNQIREVDAINNTMTLEAGCILQNAQAAAANQQRLFPLSLASEGSCTIGGNLSTNAGGTAVLRFGNMRELCLGLEIVTANGDIWHGLRSLRKDNTGYDLRDLFIGAEGTLGIITAAVLKLYPQAISQITSLCAVDSIEQAIQLFHFMQARCAHKVTAFELISTFALQLVKKHSSDQTATSSAANISPSPYYVLLEISDQQVEQESREQLEKYLGEALEDGIVQDVIMANSLAQSAALWVLRESISEAQAKEGKNIKHDISLPISCIANFVNITDQLLQDAFPTCRMVTFGHLGDGNLHYNVSPPVGELGEEFLKQQAKVNRIVHDSVHQHNGSISAEHGIGTLKKEEMKRYKSEVELQMMRAIKQALDPLNIMNPGKIL